MNEDVPQGMKPWGIILCKSILLLLKSESLVVIVHGFAHWALMPICFMYCPTVRSEMIFQTRSSPIWFSLNARACLKNHFRNLQAPLCGIFYPHSVAVARYAALIRIKSPTNWDSQLTKSLFQTRSRLLHQKMCYLLSWLNRRVPNGTPDCLTIKKNVIIKLPNTVS